jgi:hypothetical protein
MLIKEAKVSAEQIRDWFFENRCDIYDESRYDESVELAAIHFGLPQSRILAILQDDELL